MYRSALRQEARFALGWALTLGAIAAATLLLFRPFLEATWLTRWVASLPSAVSAFFDLGRVTTPDGFVEAALFSLVAPIAFLSFSIGVGSRLLAAPQQPPPAETAEAAAPEALADGLPVAVAAVPSVRSALASVVALLIGVLVMAVALGAGMAIGSLAADVELPPLNLASAIAANALLGAALGLVALLVGATTSRATLAGVIATAVAILADGANGLASAVPAVRAIRYLSPVYYAEGGEPVARGVPFSHIAVLLAGSTCLVAGLVVLTRRRARRAATPRAIAPAAFETGPEEQATAAPNPSARHSTLDHLRARIWRSRGNILGCLAGMAAAAALFAGGFVTDYSATLQIMGFDPDRAGLITALIAGATAAVVAALFDARQRVAVATGAAAVLTAFYPTFRAETRAALAATGADGTFDATGWLLSVGTLIVTAVLVGWLANLVGADVRRRARSVVAAAVALRSNPTRRTAEARFLAASAMLVLAVVVAAPLLGDMLNFAPDAHMRRGAPPAVALFGGSSTNGGAPANANSSAQPGASGSTTTKVPPDRLVVPAGLVAGPMPGSFVTAGALNPARPWAGHAPTGGGRTFSVDLPAPWTGGNRDTATLDVYLPPGYDSGSRRYPVIYEPHQPLWAWEQGVHVTSLLDSVIRNGEVPPEIMVFAGQYGGPYPDSECADSWDGKEWFDRYLARDVPGWVDSHLRTIATPAGRALLGFSAGGYCAAAAIMHHPDVFEIAAIFSGYFEAGITTSTTPAAGRPFNNDPALEAQVSPIVVAQRLPETDRSRLFLALSADPANRFYADQISTFAGVLSAADIPFGILPTPLGHSWAAVREQLPGLLAMVASRQVQRGVFGGP